MFMHSQESLDAHYYAQWSLPWDLKTKQEPRSGDMFPVTDEQAEKKQLSVIELV